MLSCLYSCRKRDEANPEAVQKQYLKEIKDIAKQVNTETIVLYPYAHLSSSLSSPKAAEELMKAARKNPFQRL